MHVIVKKDLEKYDCKSEFQRKITDLIYMI